MAKALARPIKTKRDHKRAASVAKKVLEESEREPAAERRLKALLHEIEKFDGPDEDDLSLDPMDDFEDLPRRRWTDNSSDVE